MNDPIAKKATCLCIIGCSVNGACPIHGDSPTPAKKAAEEIAKYLRHIESVYANNKGTEERAAGVRGAIYELEQVLPAIISRHYQPVVKLLQDVEKASRTPICSHTRMLPIGGPCRVCEQNTIDKLRVAVERVRAFLGSETGRKA